MKLHMTEGYCPESLAFLKTLPEVELLDEKHESEAEILLIRSHTKISEKFLDSHPNLKLIVTATSGFDHINWSACEKRGIACAYCPEANVDSAAEHTLFMILSLMKRANQQYRSLRSGLWKQGLLRPELLKGKTLGLVGLGRIGQRVAELSSAFGVHLIAHDPYQDQSIFEKYQVERKGFTEILKESDVVSLHVPLTSETRHMINGSTLSEMSEQAWLVNASRGGVVEENDLILALRNGVIAGAALDVFSKEPLDANSFLLKEPQLFLTPHTGGYADEAWEKASMEAVKKVKAFLLKKNISDSLPLATPWFKKALQRV